MLPLCCELLEGLLLLERDPLDPDPLLPLLPALETLPSPDMTDLGEPDLCEEDPDLEPDPDPDLREPDLDEPDR